MYGRVMWVHGRVDLYRYLYPSTRASYIAQLVKALVHSFRQLFRLAGLPVQAGLMLYLVLDHAAILF